jgi:hypothetical protein
MYVLHLKFIFVLFNPVFQVGSGSDPEKIFQDPQSYLSNISIWRISSSENSVALKGHEMHCIPYTGVVGTVFLYLGLCLGNFI